MLSFEQHGLVTSRIQDRVREVEQALTNMSADAPGVSTLDNALRRKHQNELLALGRQLQRAEQGTLGQCENCGADIPYQRILAMPSSSRCINCAE